MRSTGLAKRPHPTDAPWPENAMMWPYWTRSYWRDFCEMWRRVGSHATKIDTRWAW